MSQISLFKSLPRKGEPHRSSETITVSDFLSSVKYGKWQSQVDAIRAIKDKKQRDNAKRNLPSVTISGTFDIRKEEQLKDHSGFIAIDIDGWTDRTPLLNDQYTYALFASASGLGIVVLVKVNPDKHKDSFRFLANHYYTTYGIAVDPAPQNVASLRFVTYDPDIYINERSHKSKTKAEERNRGGSLPIVLPANEAAEMCQECASLGIDIAPDYASYFRLSVALAAGFGNEGRGMFHTLCQPSPKYNSNQADKKFDHALKLVQSGQAKTTVGTLYWMLKNVGINAPKRNMKAVQVAAMGKAQGRERSGIVQQLVEVNGVSEQQAAALVDEVMRRDDIDLRRVAADPENMIECLTEWLKQNHPIRKNAITQKIEENGQEVTEERLNTIFLRARSCFNKKEVTFELVNRLIFSDLTPEFNPIREYIDRNRYRNSSGNIAALARTIKTENEGVDVFVRKWVLGWIAALDGHPVRSVLCLVGGQNTGKTEWFRRLPPSSLRKYYAESKLDAGKDDDLLMCQKLWVMDDEMGGKSKQDEKRFKELTSKSTFSLRAAYGRHNADYKRLAVLCGTSNDEQVLNDPTGNTRILPVSVISLDHEAYNAIDKDELFMEAVRAYESGEPWQLTREELAMLDRIGTDFETTPYERELILKFFSPRQAGKVSSYLTSTEIKDHIETQTKQRIMSVKRFGIELKRVFGASITKRVNGFPQRVYECYKHVLHENGPQVIDIEHDEEDTPF